MITQNTHTHTVFSLQVGSNKHQRKDSDHPYGGKEVNLPARSTTSLTSGNQPLIPSKGKVPMVTTHMEHTWPNTHTTTYTQQHVCDV